MKLHQQNDLTWLQVANPDAVVRLGHIRHALFDFDGTISVLRQGWEEVMIPMMVEAICGDQPGVPQVEQEVRDYIDYSSGILTIRQMQWLAEAVERYGLAGDPLSAGAYKAQYLERLMESVRRRIADLAGGHTSAEENMIAGSQVFLAGLTRRGVKLYLASGTDHPDVMREASALGVAQFFDGRIYGALEANENHAKERVIQQILDENQLAGEELLIVGDGPVEIREGKKRQALTLGMATHEVARHGWNPRKLDRLKNAGADLLAPDFSQADQLLAFLFTPCSSPARASQ
jgi:phosphoglycolate phosphatase-like HAD superfamily hydrolase